MAEDFTEDCYPSPRKRILVSLNFLQSSLLNAVYYLQLWFQKETNPGLFCLTKL